MEQFEPFTHYNNTMSSIMWPRTPWPSGIQLIKYYELDYCIYSYITMICFVNYKDKTYCINPRRYSTTTSKQVSYIRRAAKVWERKGYERILWI